MQNALRLSCAVALAFIAVSAQAKTVEFPAGNPLFKFELPDGWTAAADADGNLDIATNDKTDIAFGIIPMPLRQVKTTDDVKAWLPDFIRKSLANVQAKDLQVRHVTEGKTKSGMDIIAVSANGKFDEGNAEMTDVAFAPAENKYFVITMSCETSICQAHENALVEILDSIKPIE